MASTMRAAPTTKSAKPTFGNFATNKAALMLEKSNPGLRRSTPDSEALASSDDELDHSKHGITNITQPIGPTRPQRRTSWLHEVPAGALKASSAVGPTRSPSGSHPATPSTEQKAWAVPAAGTQSNISGWPGSALGSNPWTSTTIWNNDSKKEPPARLSEVLPSPTVRNQARAPFLPPEQSQSSPSARPATGNTSIPFSIPLHPTPKTYRSQSYSVGQTEVDAATAGITAVSSTHGSGRGRGTGQPPSLHHRPSRPSGLGDNGRDSSYLGRVREDEDDEDDTTAASLAAQDQIRRQMEDLQRENLRLRRSQTMQTENRLRDRTTSSISASASGLYGNSNNQNFGSGQRRTISGEEVELAVDDVDEMSSYGYGGDDTRSVNRRHSELGNVDTDRQPLSQIENRTLENIKRAHWQTSGSPFGTLQEAPQSRRHSFAAEVPTRQDSISSSGKAFLESLNTQLTDDGEDRDETFACFREDPQESPMIDHSKFCQFHMVPDATEVELKMQYLRYRQFADQYFNGPISSRAAPDVYGAAQIQHQYPTADVYGRNMPSNHDFGATLQPLYVVTFKCCRSDVFYIQEGTGLQVNLGDLVIVEADRGTDLGTVQHANVSWEEARALKEKYAGEHYNWLMMFSEQRRNGSPHAVNPNGLSGAPGSAVGGMGPPGQQVQQDPNPGELKPKLIKRLAQNHEVQALRDKEGNEAKAKRVCQQKVAEHRLNMEILDAEFQVYVENVRV